MSGDAATDSADDRVDKANDRLRLEDMSAAGGDLGSIGIGLSGCEVLQVGMKV